MCVPIQNMTKPPKQIVKYIWLSKNFSLRLENYNST